MTQQRKRLGLSIPITLHKKLVDKAECQGQTINALCLDIFWEFFESEGKNDNEYIRHEAATNQM